MVGIHPAYNILTFFFFQLRTRLQLLVSVRRGLESYAYNLRSSLSDEKLADKFETADKSKLETAVNEAIKWLDASQEGSKEEYEEKQKELKGVAKYALPSSSGLFLLTLPFFSSPIMQKTVRWRTWWLPRRCAWRFPWRSSWWLPWCRRGGSYRRGG